MIVISNFFINKLLSHEKHTKYYEIFIRVYPDDLFVTRPSEKTEAKAAGQKGSEA